MAIAHEATLKKFISENKALKDIKAIVVPAEIINQPILEHLLLVPVEQCVMNFYKSYPKKLAEKSPHMRFQVQE